MRVPELTQKFSPGGSFVPQETCHVATGGGGLLAFSSWRPGPLPYGLSAQDSSHGKE